MFRRAVICILACLMLPTLVSGADPLPHWVRFASTIPRLSEPRFVAQRFTVKGEVESASMQFVADFSDITIFLNEELRAKAQAYEASAELEVSRHLPAGANTIRVVLKDLTGPSAFALRLRIKYADGRTQTVITGPDWKHAESRGVVNDRYWGFNREPVAVNIFEDYEQWRRASNAQQSTGVDAFQLLPGYQIDLVRSAAPDEDSWIAMDFDPQGRLIIAREKVGLLRLTLKDGKVTRREIINEDLPEIRGVLFAHGALYVNSNSHNLRTTPRNRTGGLYRLRDTTGDDQFDEVKLMGERTGTGGHGRNDITLGPDGKIYLIGGDAVQRPMDYTDLTPRIPHFQPGDGLPNGHVMRTDKDGKKWELVCKGLRNPYGIDFNSDGEMFTFDADAEHDMGAPWYRPTHVRQLVQGADYGWRRVTGKWPPYYPDHPDGPPNTLVIGKSSPTSVKFGSKSHFPGAYRQALFILDWTYGRIMAIHMTPRGAGYQCRNEVFLQGRPANVTDLAFGPDGSMYFVTGGRGTQSGLYRVRYTGPEPKPIRVTRQENSRIAFGVQSRNVRDRFPGNETLAKQNLGNPDPWIRYAARSNLEESQRLDLDRLKQTGTNPAADLTYLSSLARSGSTPILSTLPDRLNQLNWNNLTDQQKAELIHILDICLTRLQGAPAMGINETKTRLAAAYPDKSATVNWELAMLLAQLKPADFPAKTVPLLLATQNQEETIHYLFHLRNQRAGWTQKLRHQYFAALRQASEFRGGVGLPKFLKQIRDDALKLVAEKDRQQYAAMTERKDNLAELLKSVPTDRRFVREWKLTDLTNDLTQHQPDLKRGREMYTAAACILCHQLGGEGRVFGPDLTSVASRFSHRDILESILNPSKVVSEKYRNVTLTTRDGEDHTGRIDYSGDYRKSDVRLSTNPLRPDQTKELAKTDIINTRFSEISAMPEGLLNSLTKTEILDLLAYLESGGL